MGLFSLDENNTSYKYPIIKIILTIFFMAIGINRGQIAAVTGLKIDVVPTFIWVIAGVACIYIFAISICQLLCAYWNHKGDMVHTEWLTELSVDDICKALCDSDVTEVNVLDANRIIKMGTSSEYRHWTDAKPIETFYYLGECRYSTIEQFRAAFIREFPTKIVKVESIDGISPKDTSYGKNK